MNNPVKITKFILAILLFICLLHMPYGYYISVRYLAFVGFTYLAFKSSQKGMQTEVILYAALAILFQPIFKIALGREVWNTVDAIVGIGLLISVFMNRKE